MKSLSKFKPGITIKIDSTLYDEILRAGRPYPQLVIQLTYSEYYTLYSETSRAFVHTSAKRIKISDKNVLLISGELVEKLVGTGLVLNRHEAFYYVAGHWSPTRDYVEVVCEDIF